MRRIETYDWWPELVKLKDTLSLRELAERFNVTPGAISAAFKRTGTTRKPAPPGPRSRRKESGEALPPEPGEAPAGRPGSKDERILPYQELLGEIQYKLDEVDGAREAFRWLLERDLETSISPYHHPIDVVNLFELVRTTIAAERDDISDPPDPVPFTPPPPPIWTFAPLGIPQLAQGRTGAGLAYGGLQAGLGVASVAMWAHIRLVNTPADGHPLGWTPDERVRRVQQRRQQTA